MAKFDYFEALEYFSQELTIAVETACSHKEELTLGARGSKRATLDHKLCRMENALFCDFLPPLERDNIASFAHCLLHTWEVAGDHGAIRRPQLPPTEEEKACIRLAQELQQSTAILRRVRSPGEMPQLRGFRDRLRAASDAHRADMERLNNGSLPRAAYQILLSAGKLRMELSHCFDQLIEVMLHNI